MPEREARAWLAAGILSGIAAALALVLAGCLGGPPVVCPLGTYPPAVDTDGSVESSGNTTGNLATTTVGASGTWNGTRSTDWKCDRICRKGELLSASDDGKARRVECRESPVGRPQKPASVAPGVVTPLKE